MMTVIAVLLALFDWESWPVSSAVVCVAVFLAVALLPWRTRVALLVVLPFMYLPYLWLLDDYPWHSYRWGWIGMWPILPGLLPAAIFLHNHFLAYPCIVVVTIGAITVATLVGARRNWLLGLTCLIVLALSIVNSCFAYALFRA